MQQTIQFGQVQPATFLEWKESESNANQLAGNAILLKVPAVFTRLRVAVEQTTGTALTHRHAVGGVALISGMVLASGADTVAQALLTLAAFLVAGACFHEEGEKGGEV